METPVPTPVVTLCILNIFFKSYFQHLHYKSCITQPLEQGLGSRCLCPSLNVPTTRLWCHTHCFSLFTTDIFYLFIQSETDSPSRLARWTKYSMGRSLKPSGRMRGICSPALHPWWEVILGSCSMCSPHTSGVFSQVTQVGELCLRILPGMTETRKIQLCWHCKTPGRAQKGNLSTWFNTRSRAL